MNYEVHADWPIEDRLTQMETVLYALHAQLLGNGQPGVVQKLSDDIKDLQAFKNRIGGGMELLSMIHILVIAAIGWLFTKLKS